MNHIERLREKDACFQGLKFARTQPSLEAAWKACGKPQWMLWLLGVGYSSARKRRLVQRCCLDVLCLQNKPRTKRERQRYDACIEACRAYLYGTGSKKAVEDARSASFRRVIGEKPVISNKLYAAQDLCDIILGSNCYFSDYVTAFAESLVLGRNQLKAAGIIRTCFEKPPRL